MKYYKVRLAFRYAPDRLYRIFWVISNMDCSTLAYYIQRMFYATFEHLYMFETKKLGRLICSDDEPIDISDKYMDTVVIDELAGENIIFTYDFGDNWEFVGKVYKRTKDFPDDSPEIILIEGAGKGIWEDNVWSYFQYLSGELSPDLTKEEDPECMSMPWNFEIEKLKDVDAPLDIAKEQKRL